MKSILTYAVLLLALTISNSQADTALEGTMKKMADAAHQLGPDLKQTDPTKHNKQTDLQSVATLKDGATKSLTDVPKKAQDLPPDQEKAMVADFQAKMGLFTKDLDALNADITADNWDGAKADFDRVLADEKDDHKLFRVKK